MTRRFREGLQPDEVSYFPAPNYGVDANRTFAFSQLVVFTDAAVPLLPSTGAGTVVPLLPSTGAGTADSGTGRRQICVMPGVWWSFFGLNTALCYCSEVCALTF